ncbi:MAG: nitroreductase family protein, partial [Chloroflexota bacterium]|nr:nitroreductase family protein [Chloroflexota bacterium]
MEAFEAVRTVLAVRRYRAEPLQEATVRRIVEAGRLTASSMNLQPWHFVVVHDRRTLAGLGGIAWTGRYVAEAPLAIAVAVERTRFAVSEAAQAARRRRLE